jgi:hypothetical protein
MSAIASTIALSTSSEALSIQWTSSKMMSSGCRNAIASINAFKAAAVRSRTTWAGSLEKISSST